MPSTWSTRSSKTISSGAPPPPCSTMWAYRSIARTKGTIEARNHKTSPTRDATSKLQRQYRGDGDAGSDRAYEPEEADRVLLEGGPVGAGVGAELDELGVALAGDDEERCRASHDEEPVRDRDVGGDATCDGPEHEAGGHGPEIDDRLMLEPQAVGDGERGVPGDDRGQLSVVDRCGDPDPEDHQEACGPLGEPDADLAAGHRPVSLRGVAAIGFGVERVVQEVGAAHGQAQGDEGDGGTSDLARVREHTGRAGRGDDEEVLQPLPGPGGADEAAEERRVGRLDGTRALRGHGHGFVGYWRPPWGPVARSESAGALDPCSETSGRVGRRRARSGRVRAWELGARGQAIRARCTMYQWPRHEIIEAMVKAPACPATV